MSDTAQRGTYDHLFVRNMVVCGDDFSNEGDAAGLPTPPNAGTPFGLMRVNEVPESKIHMSHTWIYEVADSHQWVSEHEHDYDEILIWTGSDPENPEIWAPRSTSISRACGTWSPPPARCTSRRVRGTARSASTGWTAPSTSAHCR